MTINRDVPNIGPRISILGSDGRVLARLGSEDGAGRGPSQFIAPHGIAVDSRGDIYLGEVSFTTWPMAFDERPTPSDLRTLRKLIRVPLGDSQAIV